MTISHSHSFVLPLPSSFLSLLILLYLLHSSSSLPSILTFSPHPYPPPLSLPSFSTPFFPPFPLSPPLSYLTPSSLLSLLCLFPHLPLSSSYSHFSLSPFLLLCSLSTSSLPPKPHPRDALLLPSHHPCFNLAFIPRVATMDWVAVFVNLQVLLVSNSFFFLLFVCHVAVVLSLPFLSIHAFINL